MILVGLGSNLPFLGRSSAELVEKAFAALAQFGAVTRRSKLYHAPAWPNEADPAFVNAVAALSSALGPEALLAGLSGVEAGFGRRKSARNAPRTLDLDLLDYGGRIWAPTRVSSLCLPHPRLHERDFVLAPLVEIAPDWRCPLTGEAAAALLARLPRRSARPI